MGESLICPECKKSIMKWLDPLQDDLLENGIMECKGCKAQFKGIVGWMNAIGFNIDGKEIKCI